MKTKQMIIKVKKAGFVIALAMFAGLTVLSSGCSKDKDDDEDVVVDPCAGVSKETKTTSIPSDAIEISGVYASADAGGNFHVVNGGMASVGAGNGNYWVEAGGTVNLDGSNITVYLKNGSTANINGDNLTAWVEEGAELNFNGSNSDINFMSGATVKINGSLSTDCPCISSLIFE